MSELLFVYGTLRRGSTHPMAGFLAQRARYLGPATVAGRLYNLGRYPGMIPASAAGNRVLGDLYDLAGSLDALSELDAYEAVESPLPSFFERGIADVTLADGRIMEAMVYWFRGAVCEDQRMASGDYLSGT